MKDIRTFINKYHSISMCSLALACLFVHICSGCGSQGTISDTDGDGINETQDLCPGTLWGQIVDEEGCADSQKDTDRDRVTDDLDICPDTPENTPVDTTGCSDVQNHITIKDACIQFRTYPSGESEHENGRYAWVELTQRENLITETDTMSLHLYASDEGDEDFVETASEFPVFKSGSFYSGLYNPETGRVEISETRRFYSGLELHLPQGIVGGDYEFVLSVEEDEASYQIREHVAYPGDALSPVITNIQTGINEAGGLVISWDPLSEGEDPQVLNVEIAKTDSQALWQELLCVWINSDALTSSVTIPPEWLPTLKSMYDNIEANGVMAARVQARRYNDDGMNFARGYSEAVEIPDIFSGLMESPFSFITSVYDSGGFEKTVICMALTQNGGPVNPESIEGFELYSSASELLIQEGIDNFESQSTVFGVYNLETGSIEDTYTLDWSGIVHVSNGVFSADDYTIRIPTSEGYFVSSDIVYPGAEELPVPTEASFQKTLSGNGTSINLTWSLPDQGGIDEVFVSLFIDNNADDSKQYLVTIRVNPEDGVSGMALPEDIQNIILEKENELLPGIEQLYMEVQTRKYATDGKLVACGYLHRFMQTVTMP